MAEIWEKQQYYSQPRHFWETSWWLASQLVGLAGLNKGPITNFSFLGSPEVCFETIPGRRGQTRADAGRRGRKVDGNSDDKAISVQLGWDLTELGNREKLTLKRKSKMFV